MPKIAVMPKIRIGILKPKIHKRAVQIKGLLYPAVAFALSTSKIMGSLTPFGTAFFASVCNGKNLIPVLGGMALGSIAAHPSPSSLCYVIAASVMALITIFADKPLKTSVKSTLMGAILFFVKTAASAKGGLLVYDMLINFAEGLACAVAVIAWDSAVPAIGQAGRRKHLTIGETAGIVVLFSAVAAAFNNIPFMFGIKLGNILTIAVILILNMYASPPVGAVIGIAAGAVSSIGSYNAGSIIGAYAFSSLISSLFKSYGKTGTILSFILANASITILLNGSTEVLINIYEILAASLIALALPKSCAEYIARIAGISQDAPVHPPADDGIYRKRLKKTAQCLDILSKKSISKSDSTKKDLTALVAGTARRCCGDCSLRHCCWQKKGSETKKSVLQLLSAATSHGSAAVSDIDDALKNRCIRPDRLVNAFNDAFEVYRTNIMWEKRLYDCKSLSAAQLGSVAKIMHSLSSDVRTNADGETYAQIQNALDSNGFAPSQVTAYSKKDGNLIIELEFPKDLCGGDDKFRIAPCLSDALGVKIRFNEMTFDGGNAVLTYSMCERFCRDTCTAGVKKENETVCGDSYATVSLTNGTYVTAVSDGMGSGEKAARESKNTIDLLRNFLLCGFDVTQAVRLINSSLIMTGNEEIFSTLDLCGVNMHTGQADFIKIGGASSYIREKGKTEKISVSSLPAGILSTIEPKHIVKEIKNDALIILVSDGIENASADDCWLEKRLSSIDSVNPHIVADKILELALLQSGGKAKDDMTVIVTHIWEEKNV